MPKKSVTNWDKIYEMLPEDNLSPNERLKDLAVPSQPGVPKANDTYTPKYSGNSYTPSYTGSDFNGWYKYHYGSDYDGSSSFTRASGMSDLDWEQGNNLYNYYNSEKFQNKQYEQSKSDAENRYGYQYDNAQRNRDFTTSEAERRANSSLGALERYYLLSGENLDKSKTQSQQQASVMYDKLKKYLPVQVKAQGLGGLGVSESTLLDAYNKYSSAMGSIESDYQQNRTSLDNNYQDNKRSIESDRDSAINAANNAYDNTVANIGLEKEQTLSDLQRNYDQFLYDSQEKARSSNQGILDKYQDAYKDKQQRDFSNAYNTISASTETDETKMLSYIEQFKDKLDPEDYATLQQYAKQVVQANKTKRTDVDRENAYIVAQGTVEQLIGDDNYEKAKEYLDANKEIFGDQVYNAYIKDIESKTQKNNDTADITQEELDTRVLEGKEYIQANGKEYQIKSQLSQNANEITENRDFTKQLKALGFTNPYDRKIPNGTTFEIKCAHNGENKFDYKDFALADVREGANYIPGFSVYNALSNIFNWESRCVTYYNGNWYLSEKK